MDDDYTAFTEAQIEFLAARGVQPIKEGRARDADALWSKFGLLEFFTGGE